MRRLVAALAAVALLGTGCGGLRGVDLPGGADLGDDPYELTVEFADVLELVPQSLVKVNDVPVGSVTGIEVGPDLTALVTVRVNRDVRVPADALARIRTTSLLGEKFVELVAPHGPAAQQIADGATIPLARTSRAAEVEEVLGALSLLLNGGGLAQVRTIATELNAALSGNEEEITALLGDLDELVGALDERRGEITRAIDELNRLSGTLRERSGQIEVALDDFAPGLRELEDQRGALVELLRALDRLSGVATDVVERSQDDVVADLEKLRPVLANLAAAGDDLPNSLELFFTMPFTDAAVDAFAGDYANLYVDLDLDLANVVDNLRRSNQPLLGVEGAPQTAQLLAPLLGPTGQPPAPEFPLLDDAEPPDLAVPETRAPDALEPPGALGDLLGGTG